MADCMWHGYSGMAGGRCDFCEEAEERGVDPRQFQGSYDPSFAADVMRGPDHHPDPNVRTAPSE